MKDAPAIPTGESGEGTGEADEVVAGEAGEADGAD